MTLIYVLLGISLFFHLVTLVRLCNLADRVDLQERVESKLDQMLDELVDEAVNQECA